jgi:ABC-type Fe3+ transport system permease subunit
LLASLEAIPRSGLDAARAAGAGLIARSRRLLAPFVLPPLFLAVGRAFLVQFVDPGAPLALGIRQSFGSQFVEAFLATRPYPHRAALLAITAVAIALPIGFWTRPRSDFGATHQDSPSPARGRSWVRSVVALLAAGAWSFLGFGLVYGLVRLAFSQSPVDPSLPPVGAGGLELEWVAAGVRTLAVGLAAGALAWWFALALAASATAVRATPFQTFTLALARLLPPILLAAGWLCLAEGLESWLAPVESSNPVARSLLGVARALDPRLGMPWALIAVLSLMILPRAQAHVSRTRAERGLWRSWIETATVLGATPREARRRLIAWRAIAGDFGFLLLAAAAGCEASAALLLARAPGAQTLSTLSWSQWLEAGATAAAAPALLATLITIAAALVASFGSEFEATRPSQSATRTS